MSNQWVIDLAENYLIQKGIDFVRPGKTSPLENGYCEVTFFVPEYFDDAVAVIDPPDVRILINIESREVKFVPQM